MTKISPPLLARIASVTDSELAKYVQFLKEENKILRSRVKGQVHTKPEERSRLLELGKELGRAIEEFATLQSARTLTAAWRDDYNHHRPHSLLGYQTPSAFAA